MHDFNLDLRRRVGGGGAMYNGFPTCLGIFSVTVHKLGENVGDCWITCVCN